MAGIEIKGVDALIRKLGKAAAIETLKPPMQRAVKQLKADMMTYPPQRPGSSYRRTLVLKNRWTTLVQSSANGLTGKVGNNTEYGPFVQSSRFQAGIHKGRWQTDEGVTRKAEPDIVADFGRTIDRALAGG